MPVKNCSWGSCKSDSRYPERCVGVTFLPFVKPGRHDYHLGRCLRWIQACGRPHDELNPGNIKWKYICSKVSASLRTFVTASAFQNVNRSRTFARLLGFSPVLFCFGSNGTFAIYFFRIHVYVVVRQTPKSDFHFYCYKNKK